MEYKKWCKEFEAALSVYDRKLSDYDDEVLTSMFQEGLEPDEDTAFYLIYVRV